MDISFDTTKNARNIDVHGIALSRAEEFEWDRALHVEDDRRDYGERRFKAFGFIAKRMYVLVYTPRNGKPHVISLRKANSREVKRYGDPTAQEEQPSGS